MKMDGFDARHIVGWSIFGIAIVALAGAVAINRILVIGIEATKARQTQAALAINTVYKRTQQWPQTDRDPILTDEDRSRVRAANATFRLDRIDSGGHRALYIVNFGDHPIRLNVPEQM